MIYFLGLGANIGNRIFNLYRAIDEIQKISGVEILQVSSFYETAAWGLQDQPDFLNAAIKISAEPDSLKLLDELQKIETDLGRVRREHWGARTIDIDILRADTEIKNDRLTVPHPYLYERDFAMIPLSEINPDFKFELKGDRIKKFAGSPADFDLKIVACVDKNCGLGCEGNLIFHFPEDLKHFRSLTIGNTIIFGRKTLATFPGQKPLEKRRNIILSETLKNVDGAEIVKNIPELWRILKPEDKNFVVGGAKIYRELLPFTSEIFLTVVNSEGCPDVFMPDFSAEFKPAETKIFPDFEIRKYIRKQGK